MKDKSKLQVDGGKAFGSGSSRVAAIAIRVGLLLSALCGSIPVFAQNESSLDPKSMSNEELLKFLIAKNEEAWGEIKTVKYVLTWNSEKIEKGEISSIPIIQKGIGSFAHKNKMLFSSVEFNVLQNGAERNRWAKTVLNEKYLALWLSSRPDTVEQYYHSSISNMKMITKNIYALGKPNIVDSGLYYCFGGHYSNPRYQHFLPLSKALEKRPGNNSGHSKSWKAEKVSDFLYEIKVFDANYMKDSKTPRHTWKFDAHFNFLMTEFVDRWPDGSPSRVRKYACQKFKNISFPHEFEDTRFDESGNIFYEGKAVFTKIEINREIPASQFQLDIFHLSEGILLHAINESQTLQRTYKQVDGELTLQNEKRINYLSN